MIEASQLNDDVDESEGLEEIQAAAIGFLSLDRTTESNGLPFILQACATWLSHFTFEPLRIINLARNDTLRSYVSGEECRQIMNMMAENVHEVTRSAAYNPVQSSSFSTTQTMLRRRLIEARTRIGTLGKPLHDSIRPLLTSPSKWISLMSKVGSLSSLLDFMQLVAPVFRRACPDPLERLVNLPALFATLDVTLQYYSTADVLLSVLTGRPMFFRYDVYFTPTVPESCFFLVDAPGARWAYGVPDRLVMTFAQMNALFEDFGPHVPTQVVDELEQEINSMKPIIAPSTEPIVVVGRMVVQECWFLAALIYLYMGLSGDNSTDIRVANVRTRFMKLLASVRPRRNPDSFLVLPMTILGVATHNWDERDMIRRRMLGVSECTRPGRMGNDLVRILDNVWSKRHPAVWGDLRQAYWEVAGV
ncbi:putative fungal zn(2)-cys(6) binuclear cluster domain protein [Rhizoctonia solani 123E]|uniref:Putative fungal zn(2)-cys(6) binuclear cluster domain protein n=1 Tax=Rhizoctonia solani 123E TaxID=1423351 RepID=A0A074S4G7_9AGAM|nr:putative fungal zn(2)-cys(6) binuclear cluster domain protein [Rhizoctonia solani 123E]